MKNLITYAIWSHSGRKVTLLGAEAGSGAFAAGSSFLVLGVEQATDGSGAATVHLAERKNYSSDPSGARERRILAHLKKKLAVRTANTVNPAVLSSVGRGAANDSRGRSKIQVGLGYAVGTDDGGRLFAYGSLIPSPTRSAESADDPQGPEVR